MDREFKFKIGDCVREINGYYSTIFVITDFTYSYKDRQWSVHYSSGDDHFTDFVEYFEEDFEKINNEEN